jgi:TonB-dependent SusC/RagA subfamily outer membrane receptor
METYLIYIGKAALAAGAFYLVFLALFQNQKQFTFNRIYLPVSLALSFAIPLITFTTVNYVEPVTVESVPLPVFSETFEPIVRQQSQPQLEWYHYLFAIYTAGTALFLFRLLLGHGEAWNIIRKSRVQELFNSLVNISKKDIHPFSFFSKIVLSEKTLSSPHLKIIVQHEKIHVNEKHTFDILFTEILFLLQWFNPFAWLLKDAVKNNLEYKTDHEIAKTNNAQTYQLAMVALADKQGVAPFLTALNGSQLRNRIIMMKKKTQNKYARLKQLAVLPLMAVLVMGLAEREVRTEFIKSDKTVEMSMTSPGKYTIADIEVSGIRYLDETVLIQLSGLKVGETIEVPGEDITNAIKKLWQQGLFSDVRITASKIVGDDIWLDIYLQEQHNETDFSKLKIVVDGKQIPTDSPELKDLKITKENNYNGKYVMDITEALNINLDDINTYSILENFENLYVYIRTNKYVPGTNKEFDEKTEPAKMKTKVVEHISIKKFVVKGKITNEVGNPIHGVEVSVRNKPFFTTTNKNGIYEIDLIGNNEILVFQKEGYQKYETEITPDVAEIDLELKKNKVINGKVTDENGEPVAGVLILIEETLNNDAYGVTTNNNGEYIFRKDVEGKTLIFKAPGYLKKEVKVGQNKNLDVQLKTDKNYEPKENMNKSRLPDKVNWIQLKNHSDSVKKPLYIIDGMKSESMDAIEPKNIVSITVLKEESATNLYGEKGKNGVIILTTKHGAAENIIITELQLRQFIAENIKYPVEAQRAGLHGIVTMVIEPGKSNRIVSGQNYSREDTYNLSEVVVTAHASDDASVTGTEKNSPILLKEVERVLQMLPEIDIPTIDKKLVRIKLEFKLQPAE